MTWNNAPLLQRSRPAHEPGRPTHLRLRRASALLVVAAFLVPALTGCFNGPRATTTVQATQDSSNGTQASNGALRVENATLVVGPEGTTTATLIMSLFNTGREPDTLISVEINGQPATISGAAVAGAGVELAPGAAIPFGYQTSESWVNTYDLADVDSTYVPVRMRFQRAGILDFTALTVPPVGIYEGIAPNPTTRPLDAP